MEILDRYIHQLLDQSTPESPIWYKEESDASAPAKWNYMDGCMIKAILELYHITENSRYLEFAARTAPLFPTTRKNIIWTM